MAGRFEREELRPADLIGAATGPTGEYLARIFMRLYDAFGPQHWWPGESAFEVCIGAILTQNTSWTNVAKAIQNLRGEGLLAPGALSTLPVPRLAHLIRPAGYYNLKAERLKNFLNLLMENYGGDLQALLALPLDEVRRQLLEVRGIGPETADSILLYAGHLPSFVVDAYTIRALSRHDVIGPEASYEDVRALFMDNMPPDVWLFNEFHALWVAVGKEYCRRGRPRCEACPLEGV